MVFYSKRSERDRKGSESPTLVHLSAVEMVKGVLVVAGDKCLGKVAYELLKYDLFHGIPFKSHPRFVSISVVNNLLCAIQKIIEVCFFIYCISNIWNWSRYNWRETHVGAAYNGFANKTTS